MSTAEIIAELPRLNADELLRVQDKLRELANAPRETVPPPHPALGIWKDRTDLPTDPADAADYVAKAMMQPKEPPA